jgi:hypothetical protein
MCSARRTASVGASASGAPRHLPLGQRLAAAGGVAGRRDRRAGCARPPKHVGGLRSDTERVQPRQDRLSRRSARDQAGPAGLHRAHRPGGTALAGRQAPQPAPLSRGRVGQGVLAQAASRPRARLARGAGPPGGQARGDTQKAVNKTPVAPYSPRPACGAPVSVPLTWDELDDPALRRTAGRFAPSWTGGRAGRPRSASCSAPHRRCPTSREPSTAPTGAA